MRGKKEYPLLDLLDQRFKELGLGVDKPYHKPAPAPTGYAVERAVALYAEAHLSDPFARQRIRHYIAQGYVLASDVIKDASPLIRRRLA